MVTDIETCPICGSTGPCAVDADGQAMVHTDAFEVAK